MMWGDEQDKYEPSRQEGSLKKISTENMYGAPVYQVRNFW